MTFSRVGNDLLVTVTTSGKTITVDGNFNSVGYNGIRQVVGRWTSRDRSFERGRLKLNSQVAQLVQAMASYSAANQGAIRRALSLRCRLIGLCRVPSLHRAINSDTKHTGRARSTVSRPVCLKVIIDNPDGMKITSVSQSRMSSWFYSERRTTENSCIQFLPLACGDLE